MVQKYIYTFKATELTIGIHLFSFIIEENTQICIKLVFMSRSSRLWCCHVAV